MTAKTMASVTVQVGQSLPDLVRTIEPPDMVAYGAATWDWHRMHYDASFAAQGGLPGPVVDGQMLGALLAKQVMDAFGPGAFLRKMSFRFRSMVFAGETIRCVGEITGVSPDEKGTVVGVTQRVLVGDRVAVEPATAEVVLSP